MNEVDRKGKYIVHSATKGLLSSDEPLKQYVFVCIESAYDAIRKTVVKKSVYTAYDVH
jgi:hypothetical protein